MRVRSVLFAVMMAVVFVVLFGNDAAGQSSSVPVPAGYGRYCSILYGNGGWTFAAQPGQKSDPCADLLKSAPGSVVMRAGLWSHNGNNNVMLRCEGGHLGMWREKGDKPIDLAYANAQNRRSCIFIVSPTRLPIFNAPYGKTTPVQPNAHSDVSVANVHNFNLYEIPISVSQFGQTPNQYHKDAHVIDRKGRQLCKSGSSEECCSTTSYDPKNCQLPGCHIRPSHGGYDWIMPAGKPIRTVAAGRVLVARKRDISKLGCGYTEPNQQEIYIIHTVGSGEYAEQFLSYYGHMSKMNVKTGDSVTAGQKIGENGTTGCSSGNHLHFGTARLTNTTGFRLYPHKLGGDCGDNAFAVVIDPFGWAAPKNIDPFAWMPMGTRNHSCTGEVINPGAFSIFLWKDGSAPPNKD